MSFGGSHILCLGEALVDLICERPLVSAVEADAFVPHSGGVAANVATLAARAGARTALELGRPVIFDPNLRLHRWKSRSDAVASALACVPGALLVRCNADEARLMSFEEDLERAPQTLLKAGARNVVITDGLPRPSRVASMLARQKPTITPAERRHVRAIRDRLRVVYAIPVFRPHEDGIAELILTVLSQSTNDRNRDIAYFGLTERFPTWEQVRDAPVDEVEAAIRRGGISKVKSSRIKAILDAITETAASAAAAAHVPDTERPVVGEVTIDWLAHVPVPVAQEYLCSLPGVGRKTAACVLLFSYGMADVPVDTHVSRVGTRLGIFPEKASLLEMHDLMLEITPNGQEWELHLNLLRHGRRICAARKPLCRECALARMCPSRDTLMT